MGDPKVRPCRGEHSACPRSYPLHVFFKSDKLEPALTLNPGHVVRAALGFVVQFIRQE